MDVKQFLEIDNEHCVMVEFVNESGKLAVGYRNWLRPTYTDDELRKMQDEKKIIQIAWPKADVKSARDMRTVLKNLPKNSWKTNCPIKVHRFGGK